MKRFSRSEIKGQYIFIIVCEVYYYNSYSYSLEGAINCVQMCECYNGRGIHFGGKASRLDIACLA